MSAEPVPIGGGLGDVVEVPPEEWQELFGENEFFKGRGFPDPANNKALALRDPITGQVKAFWWMCTAVHFEPLWIHPDYRKNPGVIRRLWAGVKRLAQNYGVKAGFCLVSYDNDMAEEVIRAGYRLGFRRAGADLYWVRLDSEEKS